MRSHGPALVDSSLAVAASGASRMIDGFEVQQALDDEAVPKVKHHAAFELTCTPEQITVTLPVADRG